MRGINFIDNRTPSMGLFIIMDFITDHRGVTNPEAVSEGEPFEIMDIGHMTEVVENLAKINSKNLETFSNRNPDNIESSYIIKKLLRYDL